MAGPLAERELNARPHRSLRFAVAEHADEAAVRRLLRNNPMRGAVSVTFEREPDYFDGANVAGGTDQTILAYEEGDLVCVGRRTSRDYWVNGAVTPAGYLAELRLDQRARRRFAIVRDGYHFFHELEPHPPRLYFTSIASDNHRARRLLESGARGLPIYTFMGELTTVLVACPRPSTVFKPSSGIGSLKPAGDEQIPTLLELLNQNGRRFQLATVWTEDGIRTLARHGLPLDRFHLVKRGDAIIGCAALWDQRGFRQIVVRGYSRVLQWLRPLVNAVSRFRGLPGLPEPGTVLAQAFLSPLALAEDADALLPDLIAAFLPKASALGLEWLTVDLPSGDPRLALLRRRFVTRSWPSRLYQVTWPDQPKRLAAPMKVSTDRPLLPDVALL